MQDAISFCPHLTDQPMRSKGYRQSWCGVFGCTYRSCNECYEAHVFSVHFFEAPSAFRTAENYTTAQYRGRWAERICRGNTIPPKL